MLVNPASFSTPDVGNRRPWACLLHRMRQQRIEELKGGARSTSTAAQEVLGFAEVALDISSITAEAAPPRKRRRLDVLDVDEDDEESEDDELMLDWRAKTV